jgi:hypothetical protein
MGRHRATAGGSVSSSHAGEMRTPEDQLTVSPNTGWQPHARRWYRERRAARVNTNPLGRQERIVSKRSPFLAIAVLLAGCGLVSRDEVARVGSPDGHVDAVLVETDGGATTSFGYEIHVVEKGKSYGEAVATLYGALRNDHTYGANLRWRTDSELMVEYQQARAAALEKSSVRAAGRDIHIVLRPGVSDSKARLAECSMTMSADGDRRNSGRGLTPSMEPTPRGAAHRQPVTPNTGLRVSADTSCLTI